MNVLWLGYPDNPLIDYLQKCGDEVMDNHAGCEFLISYGYDHLISPSMLRRFPDRAINLHISFLPWNRGADPNLWSWIDDTPKGVTIHHLDTGIDTGDIIAQKLVKFGEDETLSTSYTKLRTEVENLFMDWWPAIRAGNTHRIRQIGTHHYKKDRALVEHLLTEGWNTPVSALRKQTCYQTAPPLGPY